MLCSPTLRQLLFAVTATAAGSCFAADTAIVNANIEVGNGQTLTAATVLIRNGRLAEVGTTVNVPAGATVIDAKGKTLYPGFIDGYSTSGLKIPTAPASGLAPDSHSTIQAKMWHENRKGIRSDVVAAKCIDSTAHFTDQYKQGITTALLSPGGGSISGTASVVDLNDAHTPLMNNAAVELSFRGGGGGRPDAGSTTSGTGYPGTLFGVTAVLRQTLADAYTYSSQPPAKKDEGFENLRPLVNRVEPAVFFAQTAREIYRACRMADEFNIRLMIVGGREAYKEIDCLKTNKIPVIVSLDPGLEPSKKASTDPDSPPQAVVDERYATWKEHAQNIKVLNDAGVTFIFSSMGGLDDYLKDVRQVIATGVPRDTALKAMTFTAASVLGIGNQVGTVEAGKLANLVLMDKPFDDPHAQVDSVFIEGKQIQVAKGASK